MSILITKSKNISNNFLIDVVINEFSFDFKLKQTIQANKVNIEKLGFYMNQLHLAENISSNKYDILELKTNFDNNKIRNLFSNFRTMDLIELFNLKDYEKLGILQMKLRYIYM